MDRKRIHFQGIIAAMGLMVLIFDSNLAIKGAKEGIELCLRTVIPSLFPFFVLSMVFIQSFPENVSFPVSSISNLMGIPKGAESLVIPAFLGGYPVGAKCVNELFQRHQIGKEDAERLLAFCSNAGPSFLFGMISGLFQERRQAWFLWFIHIFSAVLTALSIPAKYGNLKVKQSENATEDTSTILSAAKAMGLVCCWVILFRTIISFLDAWFFRILPDWLQVLMIGVLELTNGCCELLLVENISTRFVLCACMLSFGGICVLFQTVSVTKGLSLKYYLKGKLLQTVFSFLLSCALVMDHGMILLLWIPVIIGIFRKTENKYSNLHFFPV